MHVHLSRGTLITLLAAVNAGHSIEMVVDICQDDECPYRGGDVSIGDAIKLTEQKGKN